jgi:hypothetical protein
MYSIMETILIPFLFFIIVLESGTSINYIRLYLLQIIYDSINDFTDYFNKEKCLMIEQVNEELETNENNKLIKEEKFEDKYLEKYKTFPNEFIFDETELNEEMDEYNKIKMQFRKYKFESTQEIMEELSKIKELMDNGGFREKIDNENELYTDTINSNGIDLLLNYFDMMEQYEDDSDDINIEELYTDVLNKRENLLKKMLEVESMIMTDDEAHLKARDTIITKKLNKYINNYILEHTPLGNIYMRYNNDKKSFEYFSNNSIPYRYLEPVGRKYVMTYWCKPIFVDIEEELKRAEERFNEKKKEEELKIEDEKKKDEERKKNKETKPKDIFVKLKNYNKDTKEQSVKPMKNRSDKNMVLPAQIQKNLPDVNKTSEKQLLKENANRYTWEGRLTNFCPLKKIDKKVSDKKLNMTYSEFKKIQQQAQNKK